MDDGVLDQVGKQLCQQFPIAENLTGRSSLNSSAWPESSATGANNSRKWAAARQVQWCESGAAGAGLDLGDAQQGGEQGQDIVGGGDGRFQSFVVILGVAARSRARSRRWRRCVTGVRRSWAMSLVTWVTLSISAAMRSSMALMVSDRRSSSSCGAPDRDAGGADRRP